MRLQQQINMHVLTPVSCSAEKDGVATNRHVTVAENFMLTPLYYILHALVVHTMLELGFSSK
jgi:hypothetical protein